MTAGPDFRIEGRLYRQGIWPVAGVDEVGRGPLAGPVAAAAVILDPKRLPRALDDSKALTQKEREAAFDRIMETAIAVGVAFVTPVEIDAMNIRQASLAAMVRAVSALSHAPAYALIDGSDPPRLTCPCRAIIKGDASTLSIAAASIVAKVARDAMMRRLGALYPAYGFETNVGYAAKRHLDALRENGPTPAHRSSFSPVRESLRSFPQG
ncbi:MAG: ribonuclease HII [Methylocystis sp.]